jgi:hypothetical protein
MVKKILITNYLLRRFKILNSFNTGVAQATRSIPEYKLIEAVAEPKES